MTTCLRYLKQTSLWNGHHRFNIVLPLSDDEDDSGKKYHIDECAGICVCHESAMLSNSCCMCVYDNNYINGFVKVVNQWDDLSLCACTNSNDSSNSNEFRTTIWMWVFLVIDTFKLVQLNPLNTWKDTVRCNLIWMEYFSA